MKHLSKMKIAFFASLATVAAQTQAALPAEVSTAFTALGTDVGELMGYVWTAAILITFGFVTLKLFKRGANKAS